MRQRPDFMATSMGWRSQPRMRLGAGFTQASATKANHMSKMVRWRVQTGGDQTETKPLAR